MAAHRAAASVQSSPTCGDSNRDAVENLERIEFVRNEKLERSAVARSHQKSMSQCSSECLEPKKRDDPKRRTEPSFSSLRDVFAVQGQEDLVFSGTDINFKIQKT